MLNNKGQSLVLFVILIPIFLGIMVLVIDYGLDNMDKADVLNDMKELAKLNNEKFSFEINFNDMEFYVNSSYYVNGIFSNIFKMKGFLVKSKYKGYKELDKKIIKKIN